MFTSAKHFVAVIVFAVFMSGASLFAQAPASDDTFTSNEWDANFGKLSFLVVQGPSSSTYIRFDLSSLPPGVTGDEVRKATIRLYVSGVTHPGTFNVHRVGSAWTERKMSGQSQPLLGAIELNNVEVSQQSKEHYLTLDITPLVRDWLSQAQPNYGIALVPNGEISVAFDSKENNQTSHDPQLNVVLADAGPRGPQGLQGPAGPQGLQGPKGDTGATGAAGPQGPQGVTGPAGPAGPQGLQGLKGDTGATGATGPQGAAGPQGPAGPQGLKGDTGAQGAVGPAGPAGPQGTQGPKGDTGATGPAGAQGPAGPQGPQGIMGAQGPVGPQGPAGSAGSAVGANVAPFPFAVGNNMNWQNYSVWCKVPASSIVNTAGKVKLTFEFTAGSAVSIGAIKLFTTAPQNPVVVSSAAVTLNGQASPTIAIPAGTSTSNPFLVTTDPASLTIDGTQDVYVVVYFANAANNSAVGVVQNTGGASSVFGGFVSGDQTGMTNTVSSFGTSAITGSTAMYLVNRMIVAQ